MNTSPLGAMHPPRTTTSSWDGYRPVGIFGDIRRLENGSLIHERLQSQLKHEKYLNLGDLRGSSPAASLAADLSQNFCLNESSPNLPTPRRALFSSTSGTEGRDYVTTPPIPTSSPMPIDDVMDVSPLPHKVPSYSRTLKESPTPALWEDDDSEMSMESIDSTDSLELESQASSRTSPIIESIRHTFAERRKIAPRRPSLTRSKGYSLCGANNILPRFCSDSQIYHFKYGGDSRFDTRPQPQSPQLSEECLIDSPCQDKRPSSANSPSVPFQCPSRRSTLSNNNLTTRSIPITHVRRQSNPFHRSRKQYRRSQSMYDTSSDMLKQQDCGIVKPSLSPVLDVTERSDESILPHHFTEDPTDPIPRISRSTLLDVLDGKYKQYYNHRMIIDCRFEYEYEGGHIDGAVNYNDKELLTSQLFRTPIEGKTLLIFHCEFSAHRAPLMAKHIRSQDRACNSHRYPALNYPEVYILEGGYQNFFDEHKDRCYPQAYIEMNDAGHINTCEREMDRIRNHRPGRKQIGRAATFAFGEQDIDNSPTTAPRPIRKIPNKIASAAPLLGFHSPNRAPSF